MGFVFELEQPLFGLSVHVNIHEDAAGIVFFADFHIVQQTLCLEVAGSDGRHIHKVDALPVAPQLLTHLQIHLVCAVYFLLDERFIHVHALELGGEGGVAAVV